jgi:hypothetical protein
MALIPVGRPVLTVPDGGAVPGWATRPVRSLSATDLRGLAAVFAAVGPRGGSVVGSDTGPVRVAAAVGAGPSGCSGRRWLSAMAWTRLPSTCRVCPAARTAGRRPSPSGCWWEAPCPLFTAGPACMTDIDPGAVIAVL